MEVRSDLRSRRLYCAHYVRNRYGRVGQTDAASDDIVLPFLRCDFRLDDYIVSLEQSRNIKMRAISL